METTSYTLPEAEKPAIYSPAAIIGFTLLFSSLAGGILAFKSLEAVGKQMAARQALWTSIGYLAFVLLLSYWLPRRIPGLSFALGYGWGYWLSQYVKGHLPDESSYPRKSIIAPLLICLAISAVLFAAFFFALDL